jgi:RNA polymerase sigma-70 factor (ECF subfamily)
MHGDTAATEALFSGANLASRDGAPISSMGVASGRRPVLPASGGYQPTQSGSTLHPVKASDADDLVERAKSGDRAAFRELFRRHRSDVARLIFRMLGPSADVEDLVQEVFLHVHRSLVDFKGQSKFSTWLHRVTVNVVLMCRRAARSRPVFAGEVSDAEPDRGLMPDEDAARQHRLTAFRRVLERLPEKKRTVFVLHEIEGLAPAEIATIVDAPVLTVRTRLFYARRELCDLMRDEPALADLARKFANDRDEEAKPASTERGKIPKADKSGGDAP